MKPPTGFGRSSLYPCEEDQVLQSRELTYPTMGKGKACSKVPLGGDMLVPRRVTLLHPFTIITDC